MIKGIPPNLNKYQRLREAINRIPMGASVSGLELAKSARLRRKQFEKLLTLYVQSGAIVKFREDKRTWYRKC